MNAHLHEDPLPPTALQPAIPQELEDIILKAMDKDPDRRFQNAHEFRKALLKVGMVHVRAYRRLKAIRKEKDKASMPPSATFRRDDTDTFNLPVISLLDRIKDRKLAVFSGVAALAIASIGASVFMRPAPAPIVVAPPVVQAPVAAIPDESLAVSATSVTVIPEPAAKPPAATVRTPVTETPRTPPARTATAPRREPPPAKPSEPRKQENPNYDALKKAWGG